ncbi:hypothetical protein RD792_002499 [Penstemon davidsonii]|uniref:Uncharacterized protein n=1 Tax=Penstemon davidsonii TaxID=160366 RepID=A0ABR0DR75_9LAMI|nr:hypothetical protein RD792_002499 [Penstemon davidsonii]
MAKIFAAQNIPADVNQVIDQLERHFLAPDGSLISKSTYYDLQNARDEMFKERQRYLEAMAVYLEAVAMVEEYQQAVSVANFGGIRDVQGFYPQCWQRTNSWNTLTFQVCEALEHRMVVAEAAQKSRLPLISKDGDIHEEEIEKWSLVSRSSLESTCTSVTMSSSTNSTNYLANNPPSVGLTDPSEPEVGGVPNRFLGITPTYLWQTQLQRSPLPMDTTEYQVLLAREIGSRLDAKCDKLGDSVIIDDIDSSTSHHNLTSRLPERVKLIIEEIEREELASKEDLYSSDRKFAEYYNDELQKTWLCKRCETMSAKLRKYLIESTEEASLAYNKAVTRLREYQGVDPHFDNIARQYHDIVEKLETMQWTIHQVEMDLKRMPDHPSS